MAGNSSVFYLRQQINESNIKEWQNWSVDINYVVEQFNDVVSNLVNRLDLAEMTIDALMTKIDNSGVNYVKTQYDSIQIYSSDKISYSQPCGIFSNILSGENIVYVYANKSIPGLYFDDKELQVIVNEIENTSTTSDTDEEDTQNGASPRYGHYGPGGLVDDKPTTIWGSDSNLTELHTNLDKIDVGQSELGGSHVTTYTILFIFNGGKKQIDNFVKFYEVKHVNVATIDFTYTLKTDDILSAADIIPPVEGGEFVHWNANADDSGQTIDAGTTIASSISVYAIWSYPEPSNPEDPSEPGNPADPSEPSNPEDPSEPGNPADPSEPSNPEDPSEPGNPADPSEPGNTNSYNLSIEWQLNGGQLSKDGSYAPIYRIPKNPEYPYTVQFSDAPLVYRKGYTLIGWQHETTILKSTTNETYDISLDEVQETPNIIFIAQWRKNEITNMYLPFAQFSGSDAGTQHIIKTMNAAKIKGDVKLYFSLYSELESYDENYTTALSVNINYSGVITKSLYTIDKSALGKALVKNAAVASETLPVTSYGVSYGQFSTTKTVANIAQKKTNKIQ